MTIHDITQGTEEWFALRCGKFTASNFDKLFMGKSTKGYNDLINTVVYERLTKDIPESYESEWMVRGKELEPLARQRYEIETFQKVNQVGFVEQDEWTGCSPDGLIGTDGMIQIKCPKFNTFITYALFPDKAKEEYNTQVQGEMMVSGRSWSDLFIYHPKLDPLTIRIARDETFIEGLKKELDIAIKLTQERIKSITK